MYYDLENQPLRHARVSMEIPVNYWTISAATLCCLSVSATTLLCDRHLGSSGTALYGSTTVQRHVSVPMASLQQSSVREPVATRLLTSGFDDESGRSKMKINSFSRLQKLPCKGGVECINLVSNGAVLAVTENVALAEQAEDFAAVCLSSLTHFSEPFFFICSLSIFNPGPNQPLHATSCCPADCIFISCCTFVQSSASTCRLYSVIQFPRPPSMTFQT